MDNFPPVSFISTLKTEAIRVLQASGQTARGFYWSKNFAVLPYIVKDNPATVYLPEIEYHKIPNYWKSFPNIEPGRFDYPSNLIKKVMELLENSYEDISTAVQSLQVEWKQYQNKIIPFLQDNFSEQLKQITEIEIHVTAYGTKTSFDHIDRYKKSKFTCYIRQDMSIGNAVEALIQGMQFADPLISAFSWEAKESIADFLLDRAQQQGIIPNFHPTLPGLSTNQELMKKSQKYLEKLGLNFDQCIKKENQLIYVNNKIISAHLTSIQHIILSHLIDKQNQIVTYDELADILWQDENDFSIWAINKQLQRLRTKLISFGAKQDCIRSVKGRGYTLNN